jgi:enoyl-CoA hydratase/3-hydroxyacyl-CoA dehydrogenase
VTAIDEIQRITYVGAGTMGCVNSLVAAVSGYDVVLYDLNDETLASVADRQRGFADHMVAIGYCDAETAAAALASVRTTNDPEIAAAGGDLVSESVVEKVDIKRGVHAQFDRLCARSTILTTNTSSMLVSEIDVAIGPQRQFAALHSHLGSPLWDIVGGSRTTPETIDVLRRFVLSLGGVPLVLRREHRGYLVNGLIGALTRSALHLHVGDDATPDAVDRAWMVHRSAPIGPFGLLDLFGLDVVADNMSNSIGSGDVTSQRREALAMLNRMIADGHLGLKTGRGFYEYPDPAFQATNFLDDPVGTDGLHRLLVGAVIHRAVLLDADGVADPADIDLAWKAATGLDRGPFELLSDLGGAAFAALADDLLDAGLITPAESARANLADGPT